MLYTLHLNAKLNYKNIFIILYYTYIASLADEKVL